MDARALKDEAGELFRKGKFGKAAEAYAQLCKLEPKEVQHRIKMGDAYRRDGKKEPAIEAYRKAVDDYVKQGIVIKAIAACKLILEIDPNQKDAQEALATLCSKRYVRRDEPAPAPKSAAPAGGRAKPGSAIELPEDDGSEVEIENAGGQTVGGSKKPDATKPPPAGVQIGGRASAPPPPRPAPPPPPPPKPAPTVAKKPDASESIDIDMDMGEPSMAPMAFGASPSRAPAAPPPPPKKPEPTEVELDLDVFAVAPTPPKPAPPAERKRGGATFDIGAPADEAEAELIDVIPIDDRERDVAARANAAAAVPPTPMAEILSDSLLIEGELEEGEEIELVSITTGEDLITGVHAVATGATPPPPRAPAIAPPPPPPPPEPELDILEPEPEPAAPAAVLAPPPPRDAMDEVFGAMSATPAAKKPSDAERLAAEAAERAEMERAELARLANDAAFDTGPVPVSEPEPEPEPETAASPPPMVPTGDVAQDKVPIFSELPREAFLDLLEKLDFRRVDSGDVIVREGDHGKSIFVLASGKAKVVKGHGTPKAIELATLDEGSFFGEMALLNGAPRVASVVAMDDAEVLELTETLLRDLTAKHPAVAQSLKKFYRQRLLSNVMAISPLFRAFDKSDRKMLVEKFKLREAAPNEAIIKEGERPDGLYVVMHGTALVSKLAADKTRQIPLAVLKEGDVFGEMSLLSRKPASATVLAKRKTLVLRLPKAAFDELMFTHPAVLEVVSELTDQREKVNEAILSGAAESPREAVAML